MFERFRDDARQAVIRAQQEARDLHHDHIGGEHVLIGVLAGDAGPAARVLVARGIDADRVRRRIIALHNPADQGLDATALATVGIDLAEVRTAVEDAFGPGALDRPPRSGQRHGHIPFSRDAKKSLELALREAITHQHRFICDAHLVLGMLRADPNPATLVLADLGVDLPGLREAIDDELRLLAA